MSDNRQYVAIGEEAARGTKEATTVGFLPLSAPAKISPSFKDEARSQIRGEDSLLGNTAFRRNGRSWKGSLPVDLYSEAGTTKGMIGTMFKHMTGKAVSAQNAATGQYRHMMYPVVDPFGAAFLGAKALTINENKPFVGPAIQNLPWLGGRVKAVSINQEVGNPCRAEFETFGQIAGTATAEVGTPVFPAENLRFDYSGFKLYNGTITRTGSGPDFTQFAFSSANQIKPDKVSLKLEVGHEDVQRLSGLDYPDKTRSNGKVKATLEFTTDWEDPAAGFSSIDDFAAWLAGSSETNFCLVWDSGTQAGTGDNHMLIIDLPRMQRMGGEPDIATDKDPMVTLKYEGLMDATTCKYLFGIMLKNTATAV